ncbi:beta-galactosidase [Micromonospora sp. NBC_01796]|uniref:beta-galactosidase n=1 Tax=Micromonospora sp. NBC_01796 TaxID=2975987 RepID=UPI002DDA6A7C|nr:beta-galactosidase [Micromonospora sp. NBC_01796]WSA83530.1 beta-galactosidase [Micromonospora sp. NBC_01796]
MEASGLRWPKGIDGLCYGGDYNPEQWPPQVWAQDVALMRQARVNLVTVGVFAWSRLEPQPGRYDFDWLDRVLDLLHDGGIRVALATPTASPPPWFSAAHPDALPVTATGVRLHHGSRDTYCASAPAYRTAAGTITAALAERYRDHPALALWHVHNEYGTTCHCPYATEAFRRWLRDRHHSLDRVNDAWSTSFWSQHYTDWAQISTPRATQYLANPAQVLDFRRFWSDELLTAYAEQRDLLRAATPDVPVTTNYVFGNWVPVDHARWSSEVDLVAIDHYPSAADRGAEEQIAFAADLARSWARRVPPAVSAPAGVDVPTAGLEPSGDNGPGWLLLESAPNLIYTPGRMHSREPGRLARNSLAYVARGSGGAMFFQWRAPAGGAERFHSALVPHAGSDSRVFRETVELGRVLHELPAVRAGAVEASAAIGWDAECWWALDGPGLPTDRLDYLDEVRAAHRLLWRAGFSTDFVGPDQLTRDRFAPDRPDAAGSPDGFDSAGGPDPLAGYHLLVLPAFYLVSDVTAARIRAFVAGGGHLVVGYLSGVADEHGRVRLGGYPGAFREVLGIRVEEFHPLPANERYPLVGVEHAGRTGEPAAEATAEAGANVTGRLWTETVRLVGARTVFAYGDGRLAGQPAVTRHRYGKGVAWYVSTRLDDAAYRGLLTTAALAAGAAPTCPAAPDGVEAVRRRSPDGPSWLFLLNHDPEPRTVPLPQPAVPVNATGTVEPATEVVVPGGGYVVLREN